jgi:hypothetical protein
MRELLDVTYCDLRTDNWPSCFWLHVVTSALPDAQYCFQCHTRVTNFVELVQDRIRTATSQSLPVDGPVNGAVEYEPSDWDASSGDNGSAGTSADLRASGNVFRAFPHTALPHGSSSSADDRSASGISWASPVVSASAAEEKGPVDGSPLLAAGGDVAVLESPSSSPPFLHDAQEQPFPFLANDNDIAFLNVLDVVRGPVNDDDDDDDDAVWARLYADLYVLSFPHDSM